MKTNAFADGLFDSFSQVMRDQSEFRDAVAQVVSGFANPEGRVISDLTEMVSRRIPIDPTVTATEVGLCYQCSEGFCAFGTGVELGTGKGCVCCREHDCRKLAQSQKQVEEYRRERG